MNVERPPTDRRGRVRSLNALKALVAALVPLTAGAGLADDHRGGLPICQYE